MKILCRHCGQELFGKVNRCWVCGNAVPPIQLLEAPPIRRSPVALHRASVAPIAASPESLTTADRGIATGWMGRIRQQIAPLIAPLADLHPTNRIRCAYASVVVGSVAVLISFGTAWGMIPAFVGIFLGIVGMPCRRRDLATTGLILSVLAFFLGVLQIVSEILAIYQAQFLLEDWQDDPFAEELAP